MGIQISAGAPLGPSIQAAEIDDDAITAAKLQYPGWVLYQKAAFSAATAIADLTSFPAKKSLLLVINIKKDAVGDTSANLVFNADTGAHYSRLYITGTTVTKATGEAAAIIGRAQSDRYTTIMCLIAPNGVRTTLSNLSYNEQSGTSQVHLGGMWDDTAGTNIVTRIGINAGAASSGTWALYYQQDLEEAT